MNLYWIAGLIAMLIIALLIAGGLTEGPPKEKELKGDDWEHL